MNMIELGDFTGIFHDHRGLGEMRASNAEAAKIITANMIPIAQALGLPFIITFRHFDPRLVNSQNVRKN